MEDKKNLIIAIDGPAGSGKSTTAHLLARRLCYLYLDTGAMYRALTWKALKDKVNIKDEKVLSQLAKKIQICLRPGSNVETKVYLNGKDVTSLIRCPEVNKYVSLVSIVKGVREAMVAQQKKLGKNGGIVAEGRDTTTVVFPKADIKIFLNASFEQRVGRRWKEEESKGISSNKEKVATGLLKRDRIDGQRKISPLKISEEAIVIYNTHLNISQTVNKILKQIKKPLNEEHSPLV